MKSLKVTVTTFLASMMLFGCSKESTTTSNSTTNPAAKETVFQVTTNAGSNATVYLFTSQSQWSNYANNSTGSPAYTATTNSSGVATFTNIPASTYWWYVTDGCENSYNDSASTTGLVYANDTTKSTAEVESDGTLIIQNTNGTLSANIYVNLTLIGSLAAGYQFTLKHRRTDIAYNIVAKELYLIGGSEDGNNQPKSTNLFCGVNTTIQVNP